jgi:hypothetical protein
MCVDARGMPSQPLKVLARVMTTLVTSGRLGDFAHALGPLVTPLSSWYSTVSYAKSGHKSYGPRCHEHMNRVAQLVNATISGPPLAETANSCDCARKVRYMWRAFCEATENRPEPPSKLELQQHLKRALHVMPEFHGAPQQQDHGAPQQQDHGAPQQQQQQDPPEPHVAEGHLDADVGRGKRRMDGPRDAAGSVQEDRDHEASRARMEEQLRTSVPSPSSASLSPASLSPASLSPSSASPDALNDIHVATALACWRPHTKETAALAIALAAFTTSRFVSDNPTCVEFAAR